MAIVTKTVGTNGRDYSTFAAWEDDLDNDTPYDAGDTAIGECYDDSDFDETGIVINDQKTLPLALAKLIPASGQGHNGTHQSGVTNNRSADSVVIFDLYTDAWIEGLIFQQGANLYTVSAINLRGEDDITSCRNIFYKVEKDTAGADPIVIDMDFGGDNVTICDNILINCLSSTTDPIVGIKVFQSTSHPTYVYNNTVWKIEATQSNYNATGIVFIADRPDVHGKNNISIATTVAGGTGVALDYTMSGTTDCDYNLDGDGSADVGTHNQNNKATGDQFVSTGVGTEDLHLKSGADAIDTGVDLGDIQAAFDIDNRNRHDESDTWDIGADEFVAAGGVAGGNYIIGGFILGA